MEPRKYDSNKLQVPWTELKLCSQRLITGTVNRLADQANFYGLIPPVLEKIWATRSNILITGDLHSALTPDHENDKGRKLSIILKNFDLKNAIKRPTRVEQTTRMTIDLVIVNDISKIKNSGVLDVSIADHKLVYVKLNPKQKRSPPKIMYVRNYKGLANNASKENMRNALWWVCSTFEDVDNVTYAWSTMYDRIVTQHIKERKAKI